MIDCLLCFNKALPKNTIRIDEKSEDCELTVEELIKNHFWFSDKIIIKKSKKIHQVVCKSCYDKLESFYEFFCAVRSNYNINGCEDDPLIPSHFLDHGNFYVKNEISDNEIINDEGTYTNDDFNQSSEVLISGEPIKTESKKRKNTIITHEQLLKKLKTDDFLFDDFEILRSHTAFRCELCPYELKNDWNDIESHYRQLHDSAGYLRCCGRMIQSPKEVQEHVKTFHQKKKRRRKINLEEKKQIVEMFENGVKVMEISRRFNLNHTTIRTICKRDREKIRTATSNNYDLGQKNSLKLRPEIMMRMESILMGWIEEYQQKGLEVSSVKIRKKSREIFDMLKPTMSNAECLTFTGSKGWFEKFRKRYKLTGFSTKGYESDHSELDFINNYPQQ